MGGLLAGGRVDRGAKPVEDLGDLYRRMALGALEQEVLEEVRDTGLLRGLVPGAGPDPEPERDGSHPGHGLGDYTDPRAELTEAMLLAHRLRSRSRPRRPRSPPRLPSRPPRSRRGPPSPLPTVASSSGVLPSPAGSG